MAVLGTKIHRPVPRRDLVPRPRLTDLLAPLERPRLVLVAAPAGFGKTTLLAQWLAGADPQTGVAWLSLDKGDNDPRRFLEHLLAALHTIGTFAEATELVAAAAHAPSGQIAAESVLTSVVNDLDARVGGTVVALDDFHVVDDSVVQQAVAFLLENLPPQATLAIGTRADPPLPLAKLRARRELLEVRAADLRFTDTEAAAFLAEIMGLHLTDTQAAALVARTEGWPTGMQLAALSLRGSDDASAFVEAFTGSHRFVLDYLVEEVLAHQPEPVRRFLLDTAVLSQLTGPLCDALTGRDDGTSTIEELERANLFVVPLDGQRQWYRYHHLFADALRARLVAQEPARVTALHRAASQWYAGHALPDDAVRHALAGDDPGLAARIVERTLPDIRRERRDGLLREWLLALPDDVVRTSALLSTYNAWTRLVEDDADGVEAWLGHAERALATNPPTPEPSSSAATVEELRTLPSTIAMFRASAAQARGDTPASAQHAREALDLCGPEDHMARGGALGFLGLSAWARGDVAEGVATFSDALRSLYAAGDVSDSLGGVVVLGGMWLARGRPDEALRLFERALTTAGQHRGAAVATLGDLHVGLAAVHLDRGDLDAATTHLATARSLGDASSLLENRHRFFVVSSDLRLAQGDPAAAADLLDEAERLHLPGFFPDVRPIPAARARLRIAQGRLVDARDWARDWARELGGHEVRSPGYLDEYNQLTLVRLLLAEHHQESDPAHLTEATDRLEAIEPDATHGGRDGSLLEIRVLRALLHDAQGGDPFIALHHLGTALEQAEAVGHVRLFLNEGEPMQQLLTAAEQLPAGGEWARRLGRTAYRDRGTATAPAASEELSDREIEVLRRLATTLSGPDIARELFVSVNTLRTHTKHIFTKLGVNTRRAAVERARELGVL